MKPPVAKKEKYVYEINDQKIIDNYHWLRDPNWPEVTDLKILDYLKQENNYTENFFADLQIDKDKIFEELKGRIKLDDISTYVKKENYYYYHKMFADKNYRIYCRKYGNMAADEEVILDVNRLAQDHKYTNVGVVTTSRKQNLMAYSVDFSGDEKFDIKIFNLEEQKYLPDLVSNVSSLVVWHEELEGFFYVNINENMRPDKIMYHELGSDIADDRLIFEVKNPLHFLSIGKSSSRGYIFIGSGDHNEDEVYAISMQDHNFTPQLIRAAQNGVHYNVDHNGDYFYISTNYNAKNFHIIKIKADNFINSSWENIYIGEEKNKYLKSFDITNNYLILNYRDQSQGLPQIKIKSLKDLSEKIIHFQDEAFEAKAYSTNYIEDDIRINYSSLVRPATTYNYNFDSEELSILKQQEIPSGFNHSEYNIERIFVDNDSVKVPITLFYKKSLFKKDGSNPLYLMGYGAYGIAMPVSFRNSAVTLADRGFIYAVAHTRGGDDLGFDWYVAAKFLNKKRTFLDFIACTQTLIKEKYTSKNNIVIVGGSAGGMLIGAVLNERPDLYKAAVAHVPFVDVLNTMLDDTLPLTLLEFKEWGNPREPEYFEYIKSYSPYDNIKAQNYPSLLVTCGISDPRVGYYEAAKWTAKLREYKTDANMLLLKTNMNCGHQGASGRFDYLKEAADELVFIFKIFAITLPL